MEDTASLITKCVDSALSQLDFVDKSAFYTSLQANYGIKPQEIGQKFETFHEALLKEFGFRHFRIERLIIRLLHNEGKYGGPNRSVEIAAFSEITDVLSAEITGNIDKNIELAASKEYARRLEEKVKAYDDKLKLTEHLATVGRTAAMVGHDLRNPLQAIAGDLYLADTDVASLPDSEIKKSLQDNLKSIESNLYYIDKIVSDLQDYAKPLKPNFEDVFVEKVIEAALQIVPIPNNLEVVIEVEPLLPPIKADFYLIKKVLVNLLNNAVQAMPQGGKLAVRANKDSRFFNIEVEDTGVGIPDDVKSKLFSPMFTTKSKGQGFGLAVSKRLVEALNGTITFESQKGKGTKFAVRLPLR